MALLLRIHPKKTKPWSVSFCTLRSPVLIGWFQSAQSLFSIAWSIYPFKSTLTIDHFELIPMLAWLFATAASPSCLKSDIGRGCEIKLHSPFAESQATCTECLLWVFDSLVCHTVSRRDLVVSSMATKAVVESGVNSDWLLFSPFN